MRPLASGEVEHWVTEFMRATCRNAHGLRASRDGSRLLLWNHHGDVFLWDRATMSGGAATQFKGIADGRFLDDGTLLTTFSDGIRVVDPISGEVLRELEIEDVEGVGFDAVADRWVTLHEIEEDDDTDDLVARIRSLSDGAVIGEVIVPEWHEAVWMAGNRLVTFAKMERELVALDIATGDQVYRQRVGGFPDIVISEDGSRLAVYGDVGEDKQPRLVLIDLVTGTELARWEGRRSPGAFAPDGRLLIDNPGLLVDRDGATIAEMPQGFGVATWADGRFWVYRDNAVLPVDDVHTPTGSVYSLDTLSGGRVALRAGATWFVHDGDSLAALTGPGRPSPDLSLRAARGALHNRSGDQVAEAPGMTISGAWSPSGTQYAAFDAGAIRVWDRAGTQSLEVAVEGSRDRLAWVADQAVVLVATLHNIPAVVVSLADGAVTTLGADLPPANAAAALGDGVAILHDDGRIRVFGVDGNLRDTLGNAPPGSRGLHWRTGVLVAFGGEGAFTRNELGSWAQTRESAPVSAALILDDGTLVTGRHDGVVTRWDVGALAPWHAEQPTIVDALPTRSDRPSRQFFDTQGTVSVFLGLSLESLPGLPSDEDKLEAGAASAPGAIERLLEHASYSASFAPSAATAAAGMGHLVAESWVAVYDTHFNAKPGPLGDGLFVGSFPYAL